MTRQGDHLFEDTDQAIAHARRHLTNHNHTHPTGAVDQGLGPDTHPAGLIVPSDS